MFYNNLKPKNNFVYLIALLKFNWLFNILNLCTQYKFIDYYK